MTHSETGTTAGLGANPRPPVYGASPSREGEAGTSGAKARREAEADGGEIREEAQRLAEEAKRRGAALFENQRRAAADEIGGMVDALRKTAQSLGSEQRPASAQLAGRAADSLDRIAGSLREKDMSALFGQVEDYARQHPGLFFGGSVATGLLLARFLKATAQPPGTPPAGNPPGGGNGSGYVF